ncbi:UNVERIFIED_CONTAM: hypothetical protein Slati_3056200 [Sesamum latifolium]|uniref:DUF4218 domain-containing protein n=1 Tax=Sesamum latifolium TaxID=2727402 RepID=A0AAW2UUP4_9LAMI
MKELRLHDMKSHDFHIFMQKLIPIAFREMLPKSVWSTLTEVSLLFQIICSTTLDVNKVQELEDSVATILCNLEKILPPSFFDSMEHLIVHMLYEARVGGPVQYKWMYPFEWSPILIEASTVEAYLIEEIGLFTSQYFEPQVLCKWNRPSRNDDLAMNDTRFGSVWVRSFRLPSPHLGLGHGIGRRFHPGPGIYASYLRPYCAELLNIGTSYPIRATTVATASPSTIYLQAHRRYLCSSWNSPSSLHILTASDKAYDDHIRDTIISRTNPGYSHCVHETVVIPQVQGLILYYQSRGLESYRSTLQGFHIMIPASQFSRIDT